MSIAGYDSLKPHKCPEKQRRKEIALFKALANLSFVPPHLEKPLKCICGKCK